MDPCEKATAQFEAPLQAFAYFIGATHAVYVSAPITSGWRFLSWYREKGKEIKDQSVYREAHARDVIAPNCAQVRTAMALLKHREYPTPVLDPTAFDVPHWSQHDYRCFWGKVIERFVDRAIFLDGWEASVGCVYEFCVAAREGVPIFDERDAPLDASKAVKLIRRAAHAMEELNLDTEILRAALGELVPTKQASRLSRGQP
jgi:hypothetical protein